MSVLVIVGAGPSGTALLERIAANAPSLLPPQQLLTIHVIDPYPPGPGRVWRHEQSSLLRMNIPAGQTTMFTDGKSSLQGPNRSGPTLAEWAAAHHMEAPDQLVREELRALRPTDFATRRAQSAYLSWCFERARAELPAQVSLELHPTSVISIAEEANSRQQVRLADGAILRADLVVLALGHLDALPNADQKELGAFAERHRLTYLPPQFSADTDFTALAPGEDVLVRGLGLAFFDIMALLTEGRGGRYRTERDGSLTYLPSGREPRLHVGSRRGVPHRPKPVSRLQGPPPPLPRFFDTATVGALAARPQMLDFRADVLPLFAKELGWGYYHELFHAHADRTTTDWHSFAHVYSRLPWYSLEMRDLIHSCVPDPDDRLDLEALDRPLGDSVFASREDLRIHITGCIEADLARRADPLVSVRHSAELGALAAWFSLSGHVSRLVATGRLAVRSQVRDLDRWWHGFYSSQALGPPPFRLRELLALSQAGVVHFLGPNLRIAPDHAQGRFIAHSPSLPGGATGATALIEARLPAPTVHSTASPMLRGLCQAGTVAEHGSADLRAGQSTRGAGVLAIRPEDFAILDRNGTPHPGLLALGVLAHGPSAASFPFPDTGSPLLAQADAAARTILGALSG